MRVVFDTNILVAAFVFPRGQASLALSRIAEGRDELIVSRKIVDELLGVLSRKFARDAEELSRLALLLAELAETVEPRIRINILTDEPDNRVLECAQAGRAEAIVTGDRAMLTLKTFGNCRLLRLSDYLAEP